MGKAHLTELHSIRLCYPKMSDRLKEFNLMTAAKQQITDSSSYSGLFNFRITVERPIQLLDLEAEDEYQILRPTEYAFRTAMKLVVEA